MWKTRILQLCLFCVAIYGLYGVLSGCLPSPVSEAPVSVKSFPMGGTAVIVYCQNALQRVVDGALTTIGSTVALVLVTRLKRGRRVKGDELVK